MARRMRVGRVAVVACGAVLGLGAVMWAQPGEMRGMGGREHIMLTPGELEWKEGPASLPRGAQMAVLEGDASASGPFTFRLKLPAGYEIPAHHHPQVEHVTVVSGKFSMGVGELLDRTRARELPAGGFAVMAVGTRHFAFAGDEETVVQVHGMGPWGITYVDPEKDPRKRR